MNLNEHDDSDFSVPVLPSHAVIKPQREALGYPQAHVAAKIGITLRQYQRIESGKFDIFHTRASTYIALCRVLNLDPLTLSALPASE